MAVNIRKEQALFLAAVALGVFLYSRLETPKKAGALRVTPKEYTLPPGHDPITVTTAGPKNLRELFVEPSESRPLPPRTDLPFPELRELKVVLLPLEIGQQPPAYFELRHATLPALAGAKGEGGNGAESEKGDKDAPAEARAVKGPNGGAAKVPGVAAVNPEDRYDRLDLLDGQHYWGLFYGADDEKYEFAARRLPFAGRTIKFQWIDEKTGKRLAKNTFEGDLVGALHLAKTLENEVEMRVRSLRPASTNLEAQRELIDYLIEKGRIDKQFFGKAVAQTDIYIRFAKAAGLLCRAKVLRAQGDLPAIFKLFRGLDSDPELAGSSFQLRGLGMVESQLGLDDVAEAHLRRAVEISEPIDPRNYAALATFLLDRGRAREAIDPAHKAAFEYAARQDPTPADKLRFHAVYVRACLAIGDLEEAANGLPQSAGPSRDYLAACIAYAKQDFAAAEPVFQQLYSSGTMPDALLGLAACQLGKGDLVAAEQSLNVLVDSHPRLRHLGLAGLGLARSNGRGAEALEKIDAGIVTWPNHPYLLYLQGRQRRLNQDLEGAIEPLKKALRQHDDFLDALAELTLVHYRLFLDNKDARALESALRYVDRLVELDQQKGGKYDLFLELQGKLHYEAGDLRGARTAFEAGAGVSRFCAMGVAIIDYVQKRSEKAEEGLRKIIADLPADHADRKHADLLLTLIVRHGNKEQVVDRFDRKELGRSWAAGESNDRTKARIVEGKDEVWVDGVFVKPGQPVVARRQMDGPGRFLEFRAEFKVMEGDASSFAGVAVGIPERSGASSRFGLRVGRDERGELVVELKDGREAAEPMRTGIKVTPDEWHSVVISVDDADDADPKETSRYLRIYFDGKSLIDPAKSKLKSLRRSESSGSSPFDTEFRVEARAGFKARVAFRNYRRIQEKRR